MIPPIAGRLAYRELDDTLGLDRGADARTGKNMAYCAGRCSDASPAKRRISVKRSSIRLAKYAQHNSGRYRQNEP